MIHPTPCNFNVSVQKTILPLAFHFIHLNKGMFDKAKYLSYLFRFESILHCLLDLCLNK